MPKKLKDLIITNVDLVKRGANPDAHIQLYKSDQAPPIKKEKEESNMNLEELLKKLTPEEGKLVQDEIQKSSDELAQAKEKLEELQNEVSELKKQEPPKEDKSKEDILKQAPSEIQEMVAKIQKDAEEAKNEAAEAVKKQQELSHKIRKDEFLKKAEDLKGVPTIEVNKLSDLLMEAEEKLEKENYTALEQILKSVHEAADVTLSVAGSDEGGEGRSAADQIESEAKELAKSDNISYEQAYTKVIKTNPNLYAEYKKEKGVS